MAKKAEVYYFADGKKVALEPVDGLIAQSEAVDDLPKSVTLTKKADGDSARTRSVKNATLEYPVYSSDASGYMVALPEVRVQEETAETSTEFQAWLAKNKKRIVVVGQKRGQTIIRPVSGKGEDAIQIANEIYVAIKPAMSQPRFLRIIDRPVLG